MKKVLSLLLALTLMFAMAIPALADTTINEGSAAKTGNVVVSTDVGVKYTVTIPADVTIALNAASTDCGDITLTNAVLAPAKSLTVTVTGGELTSEGAGKLIHTDTTTELPFTLKIGNIADFANATFTSTNTTSFTANGSKAVAIDIASEAWNAAPAGAYSATLTFTVSYTG